MASDITVYEMLTEHLGGLLKSQLDIDSWRKELL